MRYQFALHTLTGARPYNQDRIACAERDNALLMVLADGLSGYAGGEVAAQALVDTTIQAFQKIRQPAIARPSLFLALCVMHAHKLINRRARATPGLTPRTTCVLCLVQNGYAYWAHVGDSRLYHFRRGAVLSRTLDHTQTESLRREGAGAEARRLPGKGDLLKCVGGAQRPVISLGRETSLQTGDALLLCSDGVWRAYEDSELAAALRYDTMEESVEELLLGAETRMGAACDNLSAITLRWDDAITTAPALEPQGATDIDQEELWEEARRLVLKQRIQKKLAHTGHVWPQDPPAPRPQRDPTMQAAIDEIESFIDEIDRLL